LREEMMMRFGMLISAVLALGLCAGCGKDAPATGKAKDTTAAGDKAGAKSTAPASKAPATTAAKVGGDLWAGLDLSAEATRLQGKWKVKTAFGGDPDVWDVKDNKITITTAKGETKLGTLKLDMPGRIGIKETSMTTYYSYTRNGDDVYVGLGRAGVKLGDRYIVSTNRGLVRFDGKVCTYHEKKMSFGNKPLAFKAAITVQCSLQAGGDKALLNYQVPKFMKEGEFDEKSIAIVGDALLDDQMKGNKVAKAE
jgi:hypothetical protein